MIKSKLKLLIVQREIDRGQKITYESLSTETGLSKTTLNRLAEGKTDRIDFLTLDKLCRYFGCSVGELLEYAPGES
ncbi:MAG: helix-turn-helix transcriptional regulator [Ardenticatenales bacterium]|nr:helix-turn-helix transcriptional regulator [Ardenticatenales bacterium]